MLDVVNQRRLFVVLAVLAGFNASRAQDNADPSKPLPAISPEARYDYQSEITFILQHLFPFPSKYEAINSLRSRSETQLSHSYTFYLGARLTKTVEVYVNPEMALGHGVGGAPGLAGYVNGDVTGQFTEAQSPYLARAFVRIRIPVKAVGYKANETELVGRSLNVIAGRVPARRFVVAIGKIPPTDVFDYSSYANNGRTQFINSGLRNNLAWDYPADARGYDWGASVSYVSPQSNVRFGTFAQPTAPAGPDVVYDGSHHGEILEVEIHPQWLRNPKPPTVAKLVAFRNVAPMGNYRNALAAGSPPDLSRVRRVASKAGLGINIEQALADGGDTGLFLRAGWNDGKTESYGFAECNSFLSFGTQLSGAKWKRKGDLAGLALSWAGISAAHRDYLAAGGLGLSLGDGRLRYAPESTLEAYYSHALSKTMSASLDFQVVTNPGYNRYRGPVPVLGLRLHKSF